MFINKLFTIKQISFKMTLTAFVVLSSAFVYGQNAEINTEDLVNYKLNDNLVNNGSFELGIGAGPIYPFWAERDRDLYTIDERVPPLPVIDDTTAADGTHSLRFDGISDKQRAGFFVRPPNLDYTGNYDLYYSINVKSDGPGVNAFLNGKQVGTLTTDWQKFTYTYHYTYDPDSPNIPYFAFRCENSSGETRSIWMDSATWRQSNEDYNWGQSSPVEAVFIPERRDSMHFFGDDVKLKFRLTSNTPRSVRLELHIRDLSATEMQAQPLPEAVTVPYIEENVSVDSNIIEKDVNLGKLQPGSYMAIIGIKDENTGELIGAEHELFSVLFNNLNTPPFKGFVNGFQDSIMAFDRLKTKFEWRGEWSPDEYWQTHNIIGTRMHRMMFCVGDNFTDENNIFSYYDLNLKTAERNNCKISFSFSRIGKHKGDGSFDFNQEILNPKEWRERAGRYVSWAKTRRPTSQVALLPTRYQYKKIAVAEAHTVNKNHSVDNIEVHNEQNLLLATECSLEELVEPKFKAMHLHAPGKKVCINYWAEWQGLHYNFSIYKFMDREGGKFIDGITYHPYNAATIGAGYKGIAFAENMRKIQDTFSTPEKKLFLGSSEEIVTQGSPGEPGWRIIQGFILDWQAGCYFSCSPRGAGFYFMETASQKSWQNELGPRAPGLGAVAVSAMNYILGGFEYVKKISLDDNYDLMITCFKNDKGKYVAVIAGQEIEDKIAEVNVDLSGLNVTEYDIWGRVQSSTTNPLMVSRWPRYFVSDSPDLFQRLEAASHNWITSDINYKYYSDIRNFRMQNEEPPEWKYLYLLRALPPRD